MSAGISWREGGVTMQENLGPAGRDLFSRTLEELTPLNRTIVSDDMDRAFSRLDDVVREWVPQAVASAHAYPSGRSYGSWEVPPSWNIREAYVSDGRRVVASHRDHVLLVAPYSMPFEGWVPRAELLEHVVMCDRLDGAYAYQHRIASDYTRRLKSWQISLPREKLAALQADRYRVKIDANVRPGNLRVREYVLPGERSLSVGILSHLCHPGQANDGLSGVLAGIDCLRRLASARRVFTYKLFVFPELFGSMVHIIAQGLSRGTMAHAVFLETMGRGERLCLKKSRRGREPIDRAIESLAREDPSIGVLDFYEGYGNDENQFDFVNVGIPTAGVQYFPFAEYHTSLDSADRIDWDQFDRAVVLAEKLLRRVEEDRIVRLRYPGPPHLTRYGLYADFVTEKERNLDVRRLLALCDGEHSLLDMAAESDMRFDEIRFFFTVLEREGMAALQGSAPSTAGGDREG